MATDKRAANAHLFSLAPQVQIASVVSKCYLRLVRSHLDKKCDRFSQGLTCYPRY
ncbi:hypothetical protein [uncultured Nostoc sp.]|uniref:hypothetical protein n=1 Tax=uncultured Nostoc sp. TaxID=340711 RepID=UPI0035CACD75